jgi:hypothetical protein
MGKIKELVLEIQDLLLNGYDVEGISLILDVPIDVVEQIEKDLCQEQPNDDYRIEI